MRGVLMDRQESPVRQVELGHEIRRADVRVQVGDLDRLRIGQEALEVELATLDFQPTAQAARREIARENFAVAETGA